MYEILLIAYLLIAIFLIFLILIQQGKGADMGASFGAGSSNTLFGASGSGSFLTRLTTALATGFFVLSLLLGAMTANQIQQPDEWSDLSLPGESTQGDTPKADIPASTPVEGDVPASDIPAGDSSDNAAKEDDKDTSSEGDK